MMAALVRASMAQGTPPFRLPLPSIGMSECASCEMMCQTKDSHVRVTLRFLADNLSADEDIESEKQG